MGFVISGSSDLVDPNIFTIFIFQLLEFQRRENDLRKEYFTESNQRSSQTVMNQVTKKSSRKVGEKWLKKCLNM